MKTGKGNGNYRKMFFKFGKSRPAFVDAIIPEMTPQVRKAC
jgi:hypothetical protein